MGRPPLRGRSGEEGADVFAEAGRHGDGEAAVGGDVEERAGAVGCGCRTVFLRDGALARDDLHAFGRAGAEIIRAGADEAEGLFRRIGEEDGVADDVAVEVDVGLGHDGDGGELGREGGHG